MKITIYELLGMIKDGKAPKKIKIRDYIYEYQGDDYMYELNDKEYWLFSDGYTKFNEWLENFLNTEVEILEEEIPKKLNASEVDFLSFDDCKFKYSTSELEIVSKINEIIDYLKSKGE